MYVHVYTYTRTYSLMGDCVGVATYTHVRTGLYESIYMYSVHMCIELYGRLCGSSYMYVHIHTYVQLYGRLRESSYMHTYVQLYGRLRDCSLIYTCVYSLIGGWVSVASYTHVCTVLWEVT